MLVERRSDEVPSPRGQRLVQSPTLGKWDQDGTPTVPSFFILDFHDS